MHFSFRHGTWMGSSVASSAHVSVRLGFHQRVSRSYTGSSPCGSSPETTRLRADSFPLHRQVFIQSKTNSSQQNKQLKPSIMGLQVMHQLGTNGTPWLPYGSPLNSARPIHKQTLLSQVRRPSIGNLDFIPLGTRKVW